MEKQQLTGASLQDRATHEPSPSGLGPSGEYPSRDPYWDYEENECGNCGGEGFVYGCSWDWQCDTYDEGEGTCLCTRHCDWCNPSKPNPELQAVLAEALARDSDGNPKGEDRDGLRAEHDSAGPQDIAQTLGGPNA